MKDTTPMDLLRFPARNFKDFEAYKDYLKQIEEDRFNELPFSFDKWGEDSVDYRGYRISVEYDLECRSDDADMEYPEGFGMHIETHSYHINRGEDCPVDMDEFLRWKYMQDYQPDGEIFDYIRFDNEHYWLPIYMYSHSGDTIATTPFSCGWDSGMVGIVFISKKQFTKDEYYGIRKSWNTDRKRDWAHGLLDSWVEGLDNYITGCVFGYKVERLDEDDEVGDEIASCWGFVGDSSRTEMLTQALVEVGYDLKKIVEAESKASLDIQSVDSAECVLFVLPKSNKVKMCKAYLGQVYTDPIEAWADVEKLNEQDGTGMWMIADHEGDSFSLIDTKEKFDQFYEEWL